MTPPSLSPTHPGDSDRGGPTGTAAIEISTVVLDLPPLVGALSRRLHEAGVPMTPERSARLATALALVRPISRRRLYCTLRAVAVTDPLQAPLFDAVFAEVFGAAPAPGAPADDRAASAATPARPPASRPREGEAPPGGGTAAAPPASRGKGEREQPEVPAPVVASEEEVLREKHFDALEPAELAELYRLMARMRIATPPRRTRRAERDRRGERIDLRRTLRGSLRTGGDPLRLARRRRRIVPRRLVMLCDISGSMEPYARAYVQFLTCARGAEVFAFATRLTRITRALATRDPQRAIQRAAAAAPDWSSGTRIGDALKAFNDRHGRRGMARGAVVVILSDGWERGDPALVGREMQRLRRLAHHIVWVNPRVSAAGFAPRAGGMAAALPHLDALVSGHSLQALVEVSDAIRGQRMGCAGWTPSLPTEEPPDDPWPSATPVPGSSVAMPSGYGPTRGRTTPGWSLGS